MRIFIFILFLSLSGFCFAVDSNVELVVVATGIGETPETAKSAALRAAVQKAIGVTMTSETVVSNDRLSKDEQIEYSAGMIKSNEILSQIKQSDGLFSVTIRSVVLLSDIRAYYVNKSGRAQIDGSSIATQLRLASENLRQKDKLFDHLFGNLYIDTLSVKVTNIAVQPTRSDDAKMEITALVSISEQGLRSLKSALPAIASTTGEGGPDVWISSGIFSNDYWYFQDENLTTKVLAFRNNFPNINFDFLNSAGEVVLNRVGRFDASKLLSSNGIDTGLYLNISASEQIFLNLDIPVNIMQQISDVKVSVVQLPLELDIKQMTNLRNRHRAACLGAGCTRF